MSAEREEIFDREAVPHLQDLYRTAARLTRNQTEAEDIVQGVFMQAWKSFAQYQPDTNCRAWLYKILFYKFSHHRRKGFLHSKRIQSLDEDESALNNARFEPPIPQNLTDEEIINALDVLPVRYREIVLLADVEEFGYHEIAEILQIPIGTVMSRLSRGRKQLRGSLSGVAVEYRIATHKVAELKLCAAY
jgi:RNA polymerase sigma-70 factor (ECF subfamily)